jgi:hypothetical protein
MVRRNAPSGAYRRPPQKQKTTKTKRIEGMRIEDKKYEFGSWGDTR